jgi:hypothetical protein
MAKALGYQRSTSQPLTIDTVSGVVTPMGSPLAGSQTTSIWPARSVNLETTFNGDTYIVSLTALAAIQIQKFNGTSWSVVGGPYSPAAGHTFTPLCAHVVNNLIVCLWTDVAAAGDGIRGATSPDGVVWTLIPNGTAVISGSLGGHSWVYRSAIWFATATGLWAIAPLHRTLTLTGVVGTYTVGELVTGSITATTAIVRAFAGATLKVDTIVGGTGDFNIGETITGASSGATGVVSANTIYVNSAPDAGNDAGLSGIAGPANLLGSFASWNGTLYFLQPKTASNITTIYRLNPSWSPVLILPFPQWTNTAFSGIPDVSFFTVTNDSGMACLFVNNQNQLSVFFSGATSTKLATASSPVIPIAFTDVSNSILPTVLATKANLGIALYDDDRRRTNNLQWFLIRDLAALSIYICPWDGISPIQIAATIPGSDFMLPFSHHGEETTFTNYSPSVKITSVAQTFPGQVRIDYTVRCNPPHVVNVFGEYSVDGDNFLPMSEGDGDSGSTSLATSPTGNSYFWLWDAFVDLQGDYTNLIIRIFAVISGL